MKPWMTAPLLLLAASPAWAGASPAQASRPTMTLSQGWRFKLDDGIQDAQRPDFPDQDWATVSVPHSWNRVGAYLAGSSLPPRKEGEDRQGTGWYRLHFTPLRALGKGQAWLQFDAASRVASVWLNGIYLGEHKGGFSRFRLEATRALRIGKPNVLTVRVDNSAPAPGNATADTLPLVGDFFVQGGLYRPVSLIGTDRVHFDMLDFGGPAVYASTASVTGGTARIALRARLNNDQAQAANLVVVSRLADARGVVAARSTRPLRLNGQQRGEIAQTLSLPHAHLWQGMKDPYLYRLDVEVRTVAGKVLDRVVQAFGVRQIRIDPQKGLFLNGLPLPLHGVGLHQDRGDVGWAMSAADIADDVRTITDMGANTIRLTHYEHGQPIHDLADRKGLLLWDEIPLVTSWVLGEADAPTPGLLANMHQQLTELIRQNYNHPSVAVWSIANEVDFGDRIPGFIGKRKRAIPDPLPLLHDLDAAAKKEDPTRPTTLAACCENRGSANTPLIAEATDVAGVNRYLGWYEGTPEQFGGLLDAIHAKRPQQPVAVSEYGAGGAVSQHTDDPMGGPVDSHGIVQPEEYQSMIHERDWAALKKVPYLWASWIWNSFDFATTTRREGDSVNINTKGLVTYDRKTKKDAYYFYKANWSTQPTVYITSRRYTKRAYGVTDVKVYSNAPATELFVNGASRGVLKDCAQKICVWKGVALSPGDNLVRATGDFPAHGTEDAVHWALPADRVNSFSIDSGAILAAPAAGPSFGSDAFFVGGHAARIAGQKDVAQAAPPSGVAATVATLREGTFSYRLPLADGDYDVRLLFAEPSLAPGQRVFDVTANGTLILGAIDAAREAGASGKMLEKHVRVHVRSGLLDLAFKGRVGEAIVSAVMVEPAKKE